MSYILREYRCSACGTTWESLTKPTHCPAWMADEGHERKYTIEPIIANPKHHKHSSWERWQK